MTPSKVVRFQWWNLGICSFFKMQANFWPDCYFAPGSVSEKTQTYSKTRGEGPIKCKTRLSSKGLEVRGCNGNGEIMKKVLLGQERRRPLIKVKSSNENLKIPSKN